VHTPRIRAFTVVLTCVAALSLATEGANANNARRHAGAQTARSPYEPLNVRLITPKIYLRGPGTQKVGKFTVHDALPVTFKFAVENTGSEPLNNVVVRFLPKNGLVSATPQAQYPCRGYCFVEWKIKRLPGHQRKLFTVKVNVVRPANQGEGRQGISAWGQLKGVNGLATSEIDMVIRIPASVQAAITTPTATPAS
jgi:hypothetical protein